VIQNRDHRSFARLVIFGSGRGGAEQGRRTATRMTRCA
jgi:hypothetical protein